MYYSTGQKPRWQPEIVTAILRVEGQSRRTEPRICGIRCCLQVDCARTELDYKPPSWCPRTVKHTQTDKNGVT